MLSSLNSVIARACLLGLLAAGPLAGWANGNPDDPLAGFKRWGSGEFRRFGFLIYEASLWAGGEDPARAPLALKLTYKRNIAGQDIANASVKEMRHLASADDGLLRRWGEQMAGLFPDVRAGDTLLGLYLPEGARFYFNDHLLGTIDDAVFAQAFFAIWLDAKTSAPELRAALLKRPVD